MERNSIDPKIRRCLQSFKRDPILRLTITQDGHIKALKQDPILDLFYGLHVGEWEDINYVTVLEIVSILTILLVLSGFVYFLPKRKVM